MEMDVIVTFISAPPYLKVNLKENMW
jgi:hypothetical protein